MSCYERLPGAEPAVKTYEFMTVSFAAVQQAVDAMMALLNRATSPRGTLDTAAWQECALLATGSTPSCCPLPCGTRSGPLRLLTCCSPSMTRSCIFPGRSSLMARPSGSALQHGAECQRTTDGGSGTPTRGAAGADDADCADPRGDLAAAAHEGRTIRDELLAEGEARRPIACALRYVVRTSAPRPSRRSCPSTISCTMLAMPITTSRSQPRAAGSWQTASCQPRRFPAAMTSRGCRSSSSVMPVGLGRRQRGRFRQPRHRKFTAWRTPFSWPGRSTISARFGRSLTTPVRRLRFTSTVLWHMGGALGRPSERPGTPWWNTTAATASCGQVMSSMAIPPTAIWNHCRAPRRLLRKSPLSRRCHSARTDHGRVGCPTSAGKSL